MTVSQGSIKHVCKHFRVYILSKTAWTLDSEGILGNNHEAICTMYLSLSPSSPIVNGIVGMFNHLGAKKVKKKKIKTKTLLRSTCQNKSSTPNIDMLGVGVGDKVLRKIRCTLIILDNQHTNLAKSSVSSTAGGEEGAKRRLLSLGRCPSRTAIFSCGHGDRTNRAHQGGSRDLKLEFSRHLKLPRQACTRRRRLQNSPWADQAFKPRLRRTKTLGEAFISHRMLE